VTNNDCKIYTEDLIDEARHPSNFGHMEKPDQVITEFNASCGDKVIIELKLDPKTHRIEDIKWRGEGCIISMASSSLLSQKLIGMDYRKVKNLSVDDMLDLLGLEED
jgi:nitrogen fixation NifU-like protein